MKKALLYDKAERMYMEDYMTFEAIGTELDCSERTVRNWAKEGNWEKNRNRLIEFNDSLTTKTQEIALLLGDKILDQLQEGVEPSSHLLNTFSRIGASLMKIKEYEKNEAAEQNDDSKEKSNKSAAEIFRQTFGMEMPSV